MQRPKKLCVLAGGISLIALPGALIRRTMAVGVPAPRYHEIHRISLGGEGGWDYLICDSTNHRLYVTRGTHVQVIDTATNAQIGDIPKTSGVHGVALAPRMNRGFTSNGRENTVTVFDLMSLKELKRVHVGTNPDAILFDQSTNRVFTFNGGSNDATAIDAASGKVLGTIPLGGRPEFAVCDDRGTIYDNIEDKNEVVAIDARKMAVKAHWSIAPCDGPSGLAIDNVSHRLFAVCGNQKMAVVNSESGKIVAMPAIGNGPDACAFDPDLALAMSSNGRDGTLTLVHEDDKTHFRVVGTVPTQRGARTMAVDPKTHRIYLITARFKGLASGEAPQRRPAMEPNSAYILVLGT